MRSNMRFHLGSLIILCPLVAWTQMISANVQVSLTCLDARNGREQWSSSFARDLRPYRCEVYPGRVVVFLSAIREVFGDLNPTVVFLDSRTGKPVGPFDTRQFVYKDDDTQIGRSRRGSQGSVHEERSELLLPNGWVSFGVARLPWWNASTNNVYFFDRRTWDLKWTLTLPERADNLSHWRDILIFSKTRVEDGKFISHLYAQPA